MNALGSMVIGIVWGLMSLVSVFACSQRNWKGSLLWLLVGVGFIVPLAY